MKNKIIKLFSLVMMGVMMLGNSVVFAVDQEVVVNSSSSCGGNSLLAYDNQPARVNPDPGETVTHWEDNGACIFNPNTNQSETWIEFDFGQETSFSKIRTWPLTNGENVNWLVQGSNDQSNYTDIGVIDHIGTLSHQGNGSFYNFSNNSTSTNANGKLYSNNPVYDYRYVRFLDNDDIPSMRLIEVDFWYDSSLNSPSVPEFSTYIYLATLAFIFAVGYRKMPELLREKN